jgi:hypothetical protein
MMRNSLTESSTINHGSDHDRAGSGDVQTAGERSKVSGERVTSLDERETERNASGRPAGSQAMTNIHPWMLVVSS